MSRLWMSFPRRPYDLQWYQFTGQFIELKCAFYFLCSIV
jgi:hypothetical protein